MDGVGAGAVRALHDDLRRQQPLVDALADCVVVVDAEGDPRAAAALADAEDRLAALGERWAHTCRWTLRRLADLERGEERARRLRDELARLAADVDEREAALKRMEADPAAEVRVSPGGAEGSGAASTERVSCRWPRLWRGAARCAALTRPWRGCVAAPRACWPLGRPWALTRHPRWLPPLTTCCVAPTPPPTASTRCMPCCTCRRRG